MIRARFGQWWAWWRRWVWRDRVRGRAFRRRVTFCCLSVGSFGRRAAAVSEAVCGPLTARVSVGSSGRSDGVRRPEVASGPMPLGGGLT